MKQDVFTQQKVASFLSEKFVPVILDIDADTLPKGFSYYAVPTFYVVDSSGKLLDKVVGGANGEQFIGYFNAVHKKIKPQ